MFCTVFAVGTYHISPDGLRELGSFTTFFSKVSGTVFEQNERHLLIKDFNYDGLGLAPIFLAGTTGTPSGDGEVGYLRQELLMGKLPKKRKSYKQKLHSYGILCNPW